MRRIYEFGWKRIEQPKEKSDKWRLNIEKEILSAVVFIIRK